MDDQSAAYYSRRAEQERRRARQAACPLSRAIHASLAATYDKIVATGEQPTTRHQIALVSVAVQG